MPGSILKVLTPSTLFLPTDITIGSPRLMGDLRDGEASLQLSIIRSKGSLTVQATYPIETLWGWYRGHSSPDLREGKACYC